MTAKSDQVKGKAKEVVGSVIGDEDLESEGKADRQAGEAKQKVDEAKDKVEEVIGDVADKIKDVADRKLVGGDHDTRRPGIRAPGLSDPAPKVTSKHDGRNRHPREEVHMYIGVGTLVVILVIVEIIYLARRA